MESTGSSPTKHNSIDKSGDEDEHSIGKLPKKEEIVEFTCCVTNHYGDIADAYHDLCLEYSDSAIHKALCLHLPPEQKKEVLGLLQKLRFSDRALAEIRILSKRWNIDQKTLLVAFDYTKSKHFWSKLRALQNTYHQVLPDHHVGIALLNEARSQRLNKKGLKTSDWWPYDVDTARNILVTREREGEKRQTTQGTESNRDHLEKMEKRASPAPPALPTLPASQATPLSNSYSDNEDAMGRTDPPMPNITMRPTNQRRKRASHTLNAHTHAPPHLPPVAKQPTPYSPVPIHSPPPLSPVPTHPPPVVPLSAVPTNDDKLAATTATMSTTKSTKTATTARVGAGKRAAVSGRDDKGKQVNVDLNLNSNLNHIMPELEPEVECGRAHKIRSLSGSTVATDSQDIGDKLDPGNSVNLNYDLDGVVMDDGVSFGAYDSDTNEEEKHRDDKPFRKSPLVSNKVNGNTPIRELFRQPNGMQGSKSQEKPFRRIYPDDDLAKTNSQPCPSASIAASRPTSPAVPAPVTPKPHTPMRNNDCTAVSQSLFPDSAPITPKPLGSKIISSQTVGPHWPSRHLAPATPKPISAKKIVDYTTVPDSPSSDGAPPTPSPAAANKMVRHTAVTCWPSHIPAVPTSVQPVANLWKGEAAEGSHQPKRKLPEYVGEEQPLVGDLTLSPLPALKKKKTKQAEDNSFARQGGPSPRLLSLSPASRPRLQPGQWYNDDIIDCALHSLQLANPEVFRYVPCTASDGWGSVARVGDEIRRRSTGVVAFPLNQNNCHWILAILHCESKPWHITAWDSLAPETGITKMTSRFIDDTLASKWGRLFPPDADPIPLPSWSTASCCPRQPNGIDCGVAVVALCAHMAAGYSVPADLDWSLWRLMTIHLCGEGSAGRTQMIEHEGERPVSASDVHQKCWQLLLASLDKVDSLSNSGFDAARRQRKDALTLPTSPSLSSTDLRNIAAQLEQQANQFREQAVAAERREEERRRRRYQRLQALIPFVAVAECIAGNLVRGTQTTLSGLLRKQKDLQDEVSVCDGIVVDQLACRFPEATAALMCRVDHVRNQEMPLVQREIEPVENLIEYRIAPLKNVVEKWNHEISRRLNDIMI